MRSALGFTLLLATCNSVGAQEVEKRKARAEYAGEDKEHGVTYRAIMMDNIVIVRIEIASSDLQFRAMIDVHSPTGAFSLQSMSMSDGSKKAVTQADLDALYAVGAKMEREKTREGEALQRMVALILSGWDGQDFDIRDPDHTGPTGVREEGSLGGSLGYEQDSDEREAVIFDPITGGYEHVEDRKAEAQGITGEAKGVKYSSTATGIDGAGPDPYAFSLDSRLGRGRRVSGGCHASARLGLTMVG